MRSENLEIVLGNALCCSGKKAVELSDMFSSGLKCTEKYQKELVILNDSINELSCIDINVNSQFKYTIDCVVFAGYFQSIPLLGTKEYTCVVIVDGVYKNYTIQSDGVNTIIDLLQTLMSTIPEITSITINQTGCRIDLGVVIITIDGNCALTSVSLLTRDVSSGIIDPPYDTTNIIIGSCASNECLTSIQIDNLINNILDTCDICKCQLKPE